MYESGLRFHAGYNNGYPTSYGNSITLTAAGSGELFCGWSGAEDSSTHKTETARLYYRNKRDTGSAVWSDWKTVAFTSDIPTSFAWGSITGKPSTFPPSSHTHSKSDVGLGNVDNTADSAKSVKYATSAGSAGSVAWGNVSGKPTASTTDLIAGSSDLPNDQIYLVYE